MVTTRTVGSLLLNGHETALLFSSQNGINILEARSEPGVESVFFLSEIGSGFLEPGGTPTTIIPRNTPPPGLQPRLVRTTLVTTTIS